MDPCVTLQNLVDESFMKRHPGVGSGAVRSVSAGREYCPPVVTHDALALAWAAERRNQAPPVGDTVRYGVGQPGR